MINRDFPSIFDETPLLIMTARRIMPGVSPRLRQVTANSEQWIADGVAGLRHASRPGHLDGRDLFIIGYQLRSALG